MALARTSDDAAEGPAGPGCYRTIASVLRYRTDDLGKLLLDHQQRQLALVQLVAQRAHVERLVSPPPYPTGSPNRNHSSDRQLSHATTRWHKVRQTCTHLVQLWHDGTAAASATTPAAIVAASGRL